ncbi:hypothetical protein GCM10009718_26740 [Isoptericola halotolerans]|uniref:DUF4386 family protein n=1 Tax=Isoptericola halotolerans TaxID=300560 RepID=A0ABX2A6P9_9MICO|nr:hypothetical protein [Isoptericola halotolerans]NOV97472.1 hypothetical protein [Isoptericola halotolerans]
MSTTRWTVAAAVAAAAAFLLFPVLRPWPDETVATAELAAAFASDRWVLAHLCGILGLGLLAPALLGVRTLLVRRDPDTRPGSDARPGQRAATAAVVSAWVGAGLSALYFGAETFGVRTVAEAALRDGDLGLLAEVEALRLEPAAVALFGAGLLLVAAAGVLVAVALWRAGASPRWVGIPLALGLVTLLPQFWGGPGLRIAHGVLLAAGTLLLGWAAARLSSER